MNTIAQSLATKIAAFSIRAAKRRAKDGAKETFPTLIENALREGFEAIPGVFERNERSEIQEVARFLAGKALA